jgi:hypothetical protein
MLRRNVRHAIRQKKACDALAAATLRPAQLSARVRACEGEHRVDELGALADEEITRPP